MAAGHEGQADDDVPGASFRTGHMEAVVNSVADSTAKSQVTRHLGSRPLRVGVAAVAAVTGVLLAARLGAGAEAAVGSGSTSNVPPAVTLGIGCPGPEVTMQDGTPQVRWAGRSGEATAVGGKLMIDDSDGSKVESIQLLVGEVGATGSPTALRAGKGVLASRAVQVVDGALSTGEVVVTPRVPGTYPVFALVRFTSCTGTPGTSADPVGFLEVN